MPEKFAKIKLPEKISLTPAEKPSDWFAPAQTPGKITDIEELVGKDGVKWLTNNMNMIGWTSDQYSKAIVKHADEIKARSDLLWGQRGESIDASNPKLFGVGTSFKLFTSEMNGGLDKDKFLASAKRYAKKNPLFDAELFYADACAAWGQLKTEGGEATIGRYTIKNVDGDLKVSGTITKEELVAMVALTYVMQERTGISADLFQAIAMQETHFNYYASCPAGVGLFQLTASGLTPLFTGETNGASKMTANESLEDWGYAAFDGKLGNAFDGAGGTFTDEPLLEKKYKKNKDGSYQLDDGGDKKFDWVRADGFIGNMVDPGICILYATQCMIIKGAKPTMTDAEIKAMAKAYNGSATKEDYANNVLIYYNYLKNL